MRTKRQEKATKVSKNVSQDSVLHLSLRWISLTAFLVEVSEHKLKSSHTWVFVWFSYLTFPFYKILFMNRYDFLFFADFLWGFLKPEKSMVFFKREWSKWLEPFAKLITKNSISGYGGHFLKRVKSLVPPPTDCTVQYCRSTSTGYLRESRKSWCYVECVFGNWTKAQSSAHNYQA